jgi:hypothetical protein
MTSANASDMLPPLCPAVTVTMLFRTAVGITPIRDSWFMVDAVRPQIRIDARFIAGVPFFSIRTLARTFETVFVFAPLPPNDPVPSWNLN